ncbi:MAG: agmatinase [Chloroflexi bacterium]|nr:agmatinase [Chloroflexota bacterium]
MDERDPLTHPDWFANPLNFGELEPEFSAFDTSAIVVLPVPYDATVEYKSGARYGPQAILAASRYLELYDPDLDAEVYKLGIHTLPEMIPTAEGCLAMAKRVEVVTRHILTKGKTLAMLGGEHSVTLGAALAHLERFPKLSVLQIDAHTDLRDTHNSSKYTHATVMRRLSERCPIVQAGVRSISKEERDFIRARSISCFPYLRADGLSPRRIEEIVAALGPEVYVTIDLDAFDPSLMAAVGTPAPGGVQWHEALALLRRVAEQRRIVGFDVMELCPPEGPSACAMTAAALAYKLMGYTMLSQGRLRSGRGRRRKI